METGDGLLVRVRASGGRLTLDQAAAIAEGALGCGNGAISLSARANLQVRGVSERTLPDLQARLGAAGLIDSDPEVERLRNILVSPLSDIDPDAAFDLAPSVAALERRLADDAELRLLPGKFSFVLDGGGRLPVGDIHADIRFEATRNAEGLAFAAYLGGDDALTAILAPSEIGEAASRLARAFLSLAGASEARRMRALVDRLGAKALFTSAGLDAKPRPRSRRSAALRDVLGGSRFRSCDRRRRRGAIWRHRCGPFQDARSNAPGPQAPSGLRLAPVAIVFRHRPHTAERGVLCRRLARSSASSSSPAICAFASSPVPERPPACMRSAPCARTRRAGRRCCQPATTLFCT